MRIAIVHYGPRREEALGRAAKEIGRGFEAQGHQVQVYNARTDSDARLTSAEFIVVASESASPFGSKLAPKLADFLSAAGRAEGKRALAVLLKAVLFQEKAALRLMSLMEKQGLVVIDSVVVPSNDDLYSRFKAYRAER